MTLTLVVETWAITQLTQSQASLRTQSNVINFVTTFFYRYHFAILLRPSFQCFISVLLNSKAVEPPTWYRTLLLVILVLGILHHVRLAISLFRGKFAFTWRKACDLVAVGME